MTGWPHLHDKPHEGDVGVTNYHSEWGTLDMDPGRHSDGCSWSDITNVSWRGHGSTVRKWVQDCRCCGAHFSAFTLTELTPLIVAHVGKAA